MVNIELYQFAAAGTILLEAESVDSAEIPISLVPKSFFMLLPREYGGSVGQMPDMEAIRRAFGITAKVRTGLWCPEVQSMTKRSIYVPWKTVLK